MIIKCPQCGTSYNVTDEAIRPRGRTVRCANCGSKWHVPSVASSTELNEWKPAAEADLIKAPLPPPSFDEFPLPSQEMPLSAAMPDTALTANETSLTPNAGFAAVAPPVQKKYGRLSTIVILVISLLGLIGILVVAAKPIQSLWPSTGRVYQGLGFGKTVPGEGLILQNVHSALISDADNKMLRIEGEINNPTSKERMVPLLTASLAGQADKAHNWIIFTGVNLIEAKGTVKFSAKFEAKDISNGNVLLTFSPENDSGEK